MRLELQTRHLHVKVTVVTRSTEPGLYIVTLSSRGRRCGHSATERCTSEAEARELAFRWFSYTAEPVASAARLAVAECKAELSDW